MVFADEGHLFRIGGIFMVARVSTRRNLGSTGGKEKRAAPVGHVWQGFGKVGEARFTVRNVKNKRISQSVGKRLLAGKV